MPKIYAYDGMSFLNLRFENDVKKYGIQTCQKSRFSRPWFENDVKKYGIQTTSERFAVPMSFENDVKKYGIQTQ